MKLPLRNEETLVTKEPRRNAGKTFLNCPEKADEISTIIFLMP